MPRLVHLFALLILVSLALPGLGLLLMVGRSGDYIENVEQRVPATFPGLRGFASFGQWIGQFEQAIVDQFPFRGAIIQGVRTFDLRIGGRRLFNDVSMGRDGWLFFRVDAGSRLRGATYVREFHDRLNELFTDADASGNRLVVVIVPPKQIIHEDQLRPPDRELVDRFADLRRQFYQGLESHPPHKVPPVWNELIALGDQSDQFVYHPQDTHYTHIGAMVVARSIVESLSPGLWQEEAIVSEQLKTGAGDLVGMAGFRSGWESWDVVVSSVNRPGVSTEVISRSPEIDPAAEIMRFQASSESGETLIPGKTLIVHDSLVGGFLRESLAEYFEDVTFLPGGHLAERDFRAEMARYDQTVLQTNERSALTVLLMARP